MEKRINNHVKNLQKVDEHCHFTGRYQGPAHSICDCICSVSHEIPFVFHNGSNYDFQLVIKHLANILVQVIMNFIGANTEKYNSVSITWDKKNCK